MTFSNIIAGKASPLGATLDPDGVNFAVFSRHATTVTLCLFDSAGIEVRQIALPERQGHVWHGYIPGLRKGQHYGFRMDGPYKPEQGHRFNHNKLLIDPYAKQLTGHPTWNDALFSYQPGHKNKDLSFNKQDSGPYMPRSVVVDPYFDWGTVTAPGHHLKDTIVYEAHVKGLTARHPRIPSPGTYAAMASDPMLEHLNKLGVTAVELLPVQAFMNDKFLLDRGLTNYWGYMTYGFFAPDPRYMKGGSFI